MAISTAPAPPNRKPDQNALLGTLMVAGAAVLWGTFSLFFRNAERLAKADGGSLSPATESFVFFGVVLVVLGPFSLFKKPRQMTSPGTWGWLAFFSVADAVNVLLYFAAMQTTTVATAVITHYMAPIFVTILAPVVLKERKQRGTRLAVGAAFIGLVLLLEPHRGAGSATWLGAAFGTSSALLFAGALMSMKRLGTWFSSAQLLCLHYPVALLVLFFFIPAGELSSLAFTPWALLILCGLLPGTIGGLLFVEGLRHLSASHAGVLTLIEPVVAVLIGVLIWNEIPGAFAFIGAIIVIAAAYRVLSQSVQHQRLPAEVPTSN